VEYVSSPKSVLEKKSTTITKAQKDLVGVDVYLDWSGGNGEALSKLLLPLGSGDLALTLIGNRGAKVWPNGLPETFTVDHWRCRFLAKQPVSHEQITQLLRRVSAAGLDFIKIENLYNFDGQVGYSAVSGG
jgi:isocitrate dehydrogenase